MLVVEAKQWLALVKAKLIQLVVPSWSDR